MNGIVSNYFCFFLALSVSCTPRKYVSTIESCVYEEKTNQTVYSVTPFGSAILPGKWSKTTFNKISYQQNFSNKDSVSIAVAINQASKYPFYEAKMSSNQFVKEMYEWDANYWKQQTGASTPILEQDSANHFILWQISSDKHKIDNYYLFGCENGIVFTVFVNTQKWDWEQKTNFLRSVYRDKKVGECCN